MIGTKRRVTNGPKTSVNPFKKQRSIKETVVVWLLFCAASAAVLVSGAIIYTLVTGSVDFFLSPDVDIVEFFSGTRWVPSGGNPHFGILPLLSGTLLVAGGALLIGGPVGIGAAIYLSEFASKRARAIVKPFVEILAGIPSVVYGFFALLVLSPIFRELFGASYFNAISAIIVMSVMILPIIVSVSDDAMRAIPKESREASYALGATKWETATKVVMPSASSGISASVLLGLARAIGETMVVTLAAGSVARLTMNPLGEVQTMTAYIAQVATGDIPPGVAADAAFAVGLMLFFITFVVNMVAARIVQRIKKGGSGGKRRSIIASIFASIGRVLHRKKKRIDHMIHLKKRYVKERIGVLAMGLCLAFAGAFLVYLLYTVFEQGVGGIDRTFLTSFPGSKAISAGIYPVILGSIYLIGLTMLFAVPMGVGAAVYLNEFAKETRYSRFLRRVIQNLAGVPSIVFGLVGLAIFARLFGFGPSLLTGSLTLAIMVLPIIVVTTEEALRSVPETFREAARGVGATKWQTVKDHVLPNALPGTLTGTVLALSRAIGETAPILFIGAIFAKTAPSGVLDGFMALPLTIFYWTRHPKAEFHDLAASTIVVLLLILLSMNAIAIFVRQRAQSRREW